MTKVATDTETTTEAGVTASPDPVDAFDHEPMRESVPARQPRPGSKTVQLIRLLSGKTGADVVAVSQKLGWQVHTTRSPVSGNRAIRSRM
jgi:hypothetical protein